MSHGLKRQRAIPRAYLQSRPQVSGAPEPMLASASPSAMFPASKEAAPWSCPLTPSPPTLTTLCTSPSRGDQRNAKRNHPVLNGQSPSHLGSRHILAASACLSGRGKGQRGEPFPAGGHPCCMLGTPGHLSSVVLSKSCHYLLKWGQLSPFHKC